MGYGEFGGGGSVNWKVVRGGAPPTGGNDPNPAHGTGQKFRVVINGVQVASVDIDSSRILVIWPGGEQPANDERNLPMVPEAALGHRPLP